MKSTLLIIIGVLALLFTGIIYDTYHQRYELTCFILGWLGFISAVLGIAIKNNS